MDRITLLDGVGTHLDGEIPLKDYAYTRIDR